MSTRMASAKAQANPSTVFTAATTDACPSVARVQRWDNFGTRNASNPATQVRIQAGRPPARPVASPAVSMICVVLMGCPAPLYTSRQDRRYNTARLIVLLLGGVSVHQSFDGILIRVN